MIIYGLVSNYFEIALWTKLRDPVENIQKPTWSTLSAYRTYHHWAISFGLFLFNPSKEFVRYTPVRTRSRDWRDGDLGSHLSANGLMATRKMSCGEPHWQSFCSRSQWGFGIGETQTTLIRSLVADVWSANSKSKDMLQHWRPPKKLSGFFFNPACL